MFVPSTTLAIHYTVNKKSYEIEKDIQNDNNNIEHVLNEREIKFYVLVSIILSSLNYKEFPVKKLC